MQYINLLIVLVFLLPQQYQISHQYLNSSRLLGLRGFVMIQFACWWLCCELAFWNLDTYDTGFDTVPPAGFVLDGWMEVCRTAVAAEVTLFSLSLQ